MTVILSLLTQILHIGLMIAAAPTAAGLMDWLDATLAGRTGPPILLPWHDLIRLSRKTALIIESVSAVSRYAPAVGLGATLSAAALVPSFSLGMALSPLADMLVIVSVLTIARVAAALAALDSGAALPGLAQQNASSLAVLAEPALMLIVVVLALMAGSFNLDVIIGQQREGVLLPAGASALAFTGLLALVFVDFSGADQQTDRMLSGRSLATAWMAGWIRRLVWVNLIGGLFLPAGMAMADSGPLAWMIGLAVWAIKSGLLLLGLSAVGTMLGGNGLGGTGLGGMVRHSLPDLIGIAALLALLAIIMVLASTGMA